jgi:PIN domain nuclease of toxin-antitoxin system
MGGGGRTGLTSVLLDTCAILWLMNGERMRDEAVQAIERQGLTNGVFVSPISAWEVATVVGKGRMTLSMAPDAWFDAVLALRGIRLAPMPPRTLVASVFLPGDPPNDPADRIIAATARAENLVLVTRDRKLVSYGDEGHVRVLVC